MYLKVLLNYILGYLNIEIEGYYIEKFINLCNNKKIALWNLKREKTTILNANIGITDFKEIRKILKKTKCRVKIKNKKGLPFIFNKYKKRKIFLLLLAICIATIIALSNFIWNIEITGTNKINKDEIMQILEETNFKVGTLKSKADTKEAINKIRLERDDVAWVGIDIKGTNAVVEIVEADEKPEIINEEEYCNLVASRDGIISKVNAANGTPLVKEGDVVKKGDILVAGWLEGKYTGTRYVHATGSVEARVWYSQKEKVSLKQIEKEYTGETETKYSLNINNFKINLYKRLSNFEKYDTIEEYKKLQLFSDFYLPFGLTKVTNKEYSEKEIVLQAEEAKNKAVSLAEEKINEQIKDKSKILNKQIKVNNTDEYIEVEVVYEVLETIETKEKIVF